MNKLITSKLFNKMFFLLASLLYITSCATTFDTVYSDKAEHFEIKSAYLSEKKSKFGDLQNLIMTNLQERKINVTTGPEKNTTSSEDSLVKFEESWSGGPTSKLQSFDIIMSDKNGKSIASCHWKNGNMNALMGLSSIVNSCLDTIFEKVKIRL